MDVVGLNREMNDAKPVAPTMPEGASEKVRDNLRPQVRQTGSNSEGDMNRLVATVVGPARVRRRAPLKPLSASALTPTSPGAEVQW